ncbi:MAG TPA: trypsin-like peptidase domain-containing protein [Candidatus Magasanikbacteria bacterium]|nr:trypsin-like peptidase domain-containing protein [Candidatus Magasanikbacteria bacterium]
MTKIRSFLVVSIVVSFLIGGVSGFLSGLFVLNWSFSFNNNQNFFRSFIKQVAPAVTSTVFINQADQKLTSQGVAASIDSEKIMTVVKKAAPAVVSIVVSKESYLLDNGIKEFVYPEELKKNGEEIKNNQEELVGSGTGFIIRSNGLIVTNRHVVTEKEATLTVVLNDGQRYPAIVLAKDQFLDIALIKIEANNLPTLTLGNSEKIQLGQTVVAIGNTLGQFQNTITSGIISGINRRVAASDGSGSMTVIDSAIQTDAAVNLGNSGGPLLNLQGVVIGINTAVNLNGQAISFALPVNSIKIIVDSVEKYGHIVRPWLGVRYNLLNKEIAEKNNLILDYGALVTRGEDPSEAAIVEGSPAAKAGLEENDVILEINDQKVTEGNSLSSLIMNYQVGETINLKVWRTGEIKEIPLILEEALNK